MLIQKDISNIYLGEYTSPTKEWILFDESKNANSSSGSSGVIASKNGKIIRPSFNFGGGNGNYSITTRSVGGTTYNVIQANECHGNCVVGLSDSNWSSRTSHKYVKIVLDYMYIAPASSYSDQVGIPGPWKMARSSGSKNTTNGLSGNYLPSVPYKLEVEINTSDLSAEYTITNLNTNTTFSGTGTHTWSKETNSYYIINGGGYQVSHIMTDYCSGGIRGRMGDVHLYYSD